MKDRVGGDVLDFDVSDPERSMRPSRPSRPSLDDVFLALTGHVAEAPRAVATGGRS